MTTPRTIPTEFIKLDDTVTDADRFISVRTRQILRLNQNALMAGNARQVLTVLVNQETSTTAYSTWHDATFGDFTLRNAAVLCQQRILLSPYTREVTVYATARCVRALEYRLFPVLSRPNSPREPDDTAYLTYNSTSLANDSTDIQVPYASSRGNGLAEYDFTVYATPWERGGSAGEAADRSITTVNEDNLDLSGVVGTYESGDIMYFDNADIEPRFITEVGTTDYQVAPIVGFKAPNTIPTAGADKVNFLTCTRLRNLTMFVVEKELTGTFDVTGEKI